MVLNNSYPENQTVNRNVVIEAGKNSGNSQSLSKKQNKKGIKTLF